MPLTPLDIQNKDFSVVLRGFKREEVNDFLDRLVKDYEDMMKENLSLKEDLENMKNKYEHYQKIEETLQKAIVVAQDAAEQVKRNAAKEADLIRREAEKEAARTVEEARYRASRILAEHENLHKQGQVFKLRLRSLVEAQLSALDSETWLDVSLEEGSSPREGAESQEQDD